MTAIKAGAVSHPTVNWNAIDWQTIHETVRRPQVRIVKAIQLSVVKPCPERAFERLERYDWKLSRTVLRGLRGSNASWLPGSMQLSPTSCLWTR